MQANIDFPAWDGEPTFAGVSRNDQDAPTPDLSGLAAGTGKFDPKPTLSLRGGNRSSCPVADTRRSPAAAKWLSCREADINARSSMPHDYLPGAGGALRM
jgi:hypothetical protein